MSMRIIGQSTQDAPANRVRVGIVGAGFIAEYHASALASMPGAQVVAVCDISQSRAASLARSCQGARPFDSLTSMLEAQALDVVHVLTPPDAHLAVASAALQAGAHVLLEKPMCENLSACDRLLNLAEKNHARIGVNQNTLFYPVYEQLRRDVRQGKLGQPDQLVVTWNWELPLLTHGPFDAWMLRDPRNIMLELGSHAIAHVLDLVGVPEEMSVAATNPVDLPGNHRFYRRWCVLGHCGQTSIDLRFSFGPGFPERSIHVRGSLGAATADLEDDTYHLERLTRYALDFDRYSRLVSRARCLRAQARRTLRKYALSKARLLDWGSPFAHSLTRCVRAFYASLANSPNGRNSGRFGREVIAQCVRMGELSGVESPPPRLARRPTTVTRQSPEVLVIGGTGFIGQRLVQQLLSAGRPVRLMSRRLGGVRFDLDNPLLEVIEGSIQNDADTARAVDGVDHVVHLARATVKSWQEFYDQDVLATRRVAEHCLRRGVQRLIYTGTIASYYLGAGAGTITECTPLDPRIKRRDAYARAKALSEEILLDMHHRQNLPVVILRPGIVIGSGGTACHWGVGMWSGYGVCQLWGDGRNKLPFVLVDDTVEALVAAMDVPEIEGEVFNLVGDPCLSAREFLHELERHAGIRLQIQPTPIWRYYAVDLFKWLVKVAVRHPNRPRPSYRNWETRTAKALFDCTKAKTVLDWKPCSDRSELIARGIHIPFDERFGPPARPASLTDLPSTPPAAEAQVPQEAAS